jgi:hypothetical protein
MATFHRPFPQKWNSYNLLRRSRLGCRVAGYPAESAMQAKAAIDRIALTSD